VQLERVDLPEQIALFSRATTVIAQHGAGLANVLWMPPGSQVIEIIPDDQDRREHFSRLAEVVGARYSAVSQVGPHAAVEPESIVAAVHDLRAAG
jgi:capsular polysaccharide biosynthesis protein